MTFPHSKLMALREKARFHNDEATLNILLIAHGFPPESVGGVEQHVDGLARALVAAGHRVEIYARTGQAGEQGTLIDDHWEDAPCPVTRVIYRYEGLESLASLYRRPELDAALEHFLATREFDVAHIHHLTGLSTGLLDVLTTAGIPTVMTLHDYWLMCPRGQMWRDDGTACENVEPTTCSACLTPTFGDWIPPSGGAEVLERLHEEARELLALPRHLIVPSARVIPPFAALGVPAERFHVVENGVDTEALLAVPPPETQPGQPLRVGYLGTLIPSKGLDILVEAIQSLDEGVASLAIWGNTVSYHGDETFPSRVFSRLRPRDRVEHHGPYTTADLPEILSSVDVVVAPALWHEAFGLTIREALAAGRPVVVSRIGGLQDAIDDGVEGLLVPPKDPGALREALSRLAADEGLRRRMSTAARQRCRSFSQMAADLLPLYRATSSLDPEPVDS